MTSITTHSDLLSAKKLVYEPNELIISNLAKEQESGDYGAFTFEMNSKRVKFRVAKITPTKVGQFVTFWKRIGQGPILPHDLEDPFDLLIVSVRAREQFGQFVFPKEVLCEKGIVSKNAKGGKRAMRVYPSWDKAENKQAKNTQDWQLAYFFEIPSADKTRIQKLFLRGFKSKIGPEMAQ